MKAVLVGTDLMYRQDGKLVPIEMNTQVGLNSSGRLEAYEDFLDFKDLVAFIQSHNITEVYLEGAVSILEKYWPEELQDVQVSVVSGFKEEYNEPGKLYVRTRYSDEALVDAFCRDKVEFLKSIKDKDFGSEFIVKTIEGLEGEITTLTSNGDLPNFIVKYRYPAYDRSKYPKLLKFNTLKELNNWVKSNLEQDYLIMPFYFNESKLYEGRYGKRLKVMRNWSLFLSEDGTSLTSLDLGTYTRFTEEILDENSRKYDGHVLVEGRKQLLVGAGEFGYFDLLAEKNDLILMADGTWKEVQDLESGEEVKSVSFGEEDLRSGRFENYGSLEDLAEKAEYSTNRVVLLRKIAGFYDEVTLEFTDGTDWFDTENSAYPVVISENEVRFKELKDVEVGDLIVLIPVSAENEEKPSFVVKEIASIQKERKEQEGYSLSLDGNHLFLSRTSEDNAAYIAIEHNLTLHSCGDPIGNESWSSDGPCYDDNNKFGNLQNCQIIEVTTDSLEFTYKVRVSLIGLGNETGYSFTLQNEEGQETDMCGGHCWFRVVPIATAGVDNWEVYLELLDESDDPASPGSFGSDGIDVTVRDINHNMHTGYIPSDESDLKLRIPTFVEYMSFSWNFS